MLSSGIPEPHDLGRVRSKTVLKRKLRKVRNIYQEEVEVYKLNLKPQIPRIHVAEVQILCLITLFFCQISSKMRLPLLGATQVTVYRSVVDTQGMLRPTCCEQRKNLFGINLPEAVLVPVELPPPKLPPPKPPPLYPLLPPPPKNPPVP